MAQATEKKKAKPEAKKEKAEGKALVSLAVSKGALQIDVGPMVVDLMLGAAKEEEKANELYEAAELTRGEAFGRLTAAIHSACEHDDTLDPAAVFDKKDWSILSERIDIALGIKVLDAEGNVSLSDDPRIKKNFPPSNPSKAMKETDAYKKKVQNRQNYATAKKKATMAVVAMIDNNVRPSMNEALKVLEVRNAPKMIAGPNAGADTVTPLTGKQNEGATKRASIAAFTELAQKAHGGETGGTKGKQNGTTSKAQAALNSTDDFAELTNAMITAINGKTDTVKAGSPLTDQERQVLTNLLAAVETILTIN